MPFEIKEVDGKHCVFKEGTDQKMGCHDSRDDAEKQMAALYASEDDVSKSSLVRSKIRNIIEKGGDTKTILAEIEKCYADYSYNYGPASFSELDEQKAAKERIYEIYSLNSSFIDLAYNILYNPEIEDKGSALDKLVAEYKARIDKPTEEVEKAEAVGLFKADSAKKLVYGLVLVPEKTDSQDDVISADEIEKAAHTYLIKHLSRGDSRPMDYEHELELEVGIARPVESYIMPVDAVIDGKLIKAGSWVMVTHVPDPGLWEKIEKGQLNSYSIRGQGIRQLIEMGED